jgi:hypothetical protein
MCFPDQVKVKLDIKRDRSGIPTGAHDEAPQWVKDIGIPTLFSLRVATDSKDLILNCTGFEECLPSIISHHRPSRRNKENLHPTLREHARQFRKPQIVADNNTGTDTLSPQRHRKHLVAAARPEVPSVSARPEQMDFVVPVNARTVAEDK